MLHRRNFLSLAAGATPAFAAARLWAAPNTDQRLLIVFLRGGYDAANVVIPTSSDFYHEVRPTLRIARPDAANPDAALALDADWGLHPVLKDTILPLWNLRQAAFVPFAGTDDLTRSHFETQDTIELGQPVGGHRDYASGFMRRLANELAGARPIAFTDQVPVIFRGGAPVANIGLAGVGKPGVDDRQAALIEAMYRGRDLGPAVAQGFAVRSEVTRTLADEMTAASRGAVSPKGFELSARRIGRLMKADYTLAFVDVGGWDTHVGEGAAKGYLAQRIAELGRGLAGYAQELGPDAWNRTTVVVVSEFGRTFRENGNRGTDHGHGSVYWVLGGRIRGGRIAGEQVAIKQSTLFQNRDWPVLTDYRALIGGLIQRLYGLGPDRLQRVFPGAAPKDMGLV